MGQISIEYTELPGLDKKGKPGLVGRPILGFTLNYKHGRMFSTNGLLDSGADYNLFPGAWCKPLGININKGIPVNISGIGSRVPLQGYRHRGIKIYLPEYSFETTIDFCMEQETALLGRNGFFDKFRKVIFEDQKGVATLEF